MSTSLLLFVGADAVAVCGDDVFSRYKVGVVASSSPILGNRLCSHVVS